MSEEPRRYASHECDPGYINWVTARARHPGCVPVVYFNGERVDRAVVADEVEGIVTAWVVDEDGRPARVTRRGAVVVRWEPRACGPTTNRCGP